MFVKYKVLRRLPGTTGIRDEYGKIIFKAEKEKKSHIN